MNATSLIFIPFLFAAFCGCWIFNGRFKKLIIIIFNTIFALTFVKWHVLYLLFITAASWWFGKIINKNKNKPILIISILTVLGGLVFFKLLPLTPLRESWTIPVGISFYTFKAISYLVDINRGKCNEKKLLDVYCYLSFFPSFTAGPIHRPEPFFAELNQKKEFDYLFVKNGAVLCGVGMFEKVVFSDYLAIVSNHIFASEATGITLIFGLVLYSFQIYLDFDSYSNIAIGAAQCLGFNVGPNFKTPYVAASLKEFWRRWHISLSSWFRDYVYIPLGGNRKGAIRKYFNLVTVFLLSGLWHGSTANFAIWGLGHGLSQVMEDRLNLTVKTRVKLIYGLRVLINFFVVTVLWIFFRCTTFEEAMTTIRKCFELSPFSIEWMGINQRQFAWLIVILIVVIIFDQLRNRMDMIEWLAKQHFVIRWSIYGFMITVFLIFGIYGSGYNPQDFIYIQF